MRKWMCVPMIALCLLLTACGGAGEEQDAADLRDRYHDMTGCSMEAVVTCDQIGAAWTAELQCE